MVLTFVDTHYMIAYLIKSDASEGFEQILDFLNASVIQYALTVNPTIYVSCIKQLWSSVSIKKTNDVVCLQALIGRKKVIITEDTVRQALHLHDAESIDCLPNEEIFTELARMGYEKPSTKLTFYKAFFSAQWKFPIHTILQCMSAKRTALNEFSSSMALAVICIATGRKFNFSKYIFDSLVRNVDSSSRFYMYPKFLQLMISAQVGDLSSHTTKYLSSALTQKVFSNMRRVGKGFSGMNTPLFEGMLVPQQAADDVVANNVPANDVAYVVVDDVIADVVVNDVIVDDVANVVPDDAAEPTPPSPTPTTIPPPPPQELPNTLQVAPTPPPSLIAQPSSPPPQQQPSHDVAISMDLLNTLLETCTTLTRKVEALEQDKIAQALKITKLKKRILLWMIRRMHPKGGIIAEIDADKDVTLEEVNAAKDAKVAEDADCYKEKKGVVIRDPEETATPSTIVHSEPKPKEKGKGILVEEPKPLKKQVQIEQDEAYARELEAELNKNINWDDVIEALKRKTESSKQQADKKQKLDEEVEELKKHIQIVLNDEDDVYTEATPLSLKVLVVDYQIHTENNKPHYKIIRVDGTYQLFISFISLLRNFNREDLEMLWKIVQEIFASSKPNNLSDDFLLATLKAMFEKPDVEAQMIFLVERRYPLTRFTLDQMLHNVRLEVKEESEVSLELLRFVRRQQQEGYRPDFGVDTVKDFKEYMLRDYYCWLKTYYCWYKLKLLDNVADSKLRLLEQNAAVDDKIKK
nr:hypothetical protein [Tanacetum cinerariifolium]